MSLPFTDFVKFLNNIKSNQFISEYDTRAKLNAM